MILNNTTLPHIYLWQKKNEFLVDGSPVSTDYPRFDSPFSHTPRKPSEMTIEAGGHGLILDYYGWMITEE
jgi:hypothetical protein